MIVENPNEYKFIKFQKSHLSGKKYDAVLMNKKTERLKLVPFGDSSMQQYKDTTGLGLYTKSNNLDKKRRDLYRKRHAGEASNKYSSGWFSWRFLWN